MEKKEGFKAQHKKHGENGLKYSSSEQHGSNM